MMNNALKNEIDKIREIINFIKKRLPEESYPKLESDEEVFNFIVHLSMKHPWINDLMSVRDYNCLLNLVSNPSFSLQELTDVIMFCKVPLYPFHHYLCKSIISVTQMLEREYDCILKTGYPNTKHPEFSYFFRSLLPISEDYDNAILPFLNYEMAGRIEDLRKRMLDLCIFAYRLLLESTQKNNLDYYSDLIVDKTCEFFNFDDISFLLNMEVKYHHHYFAKNIIAKHYAQACPCCGAPMASFLHLSRTNGLTFLFYTVYILWYYTLNPLFNSFLQKVLNINHVVTGNQLTTEDLSERNFDPKLFSLRKCFPTLDVFVSHPEFCKLMSDLCQARETESGQIRQFVKSCFDRAKKNIKKKVVFSVPLEFADDLENYLDQIIDFSIPSKKYTGKFPDINFQASMYLGTEQTIFRRSGQKWEISFGGKTRYFNIRDGFQDIYFLLCHAGKEIPCIKLICKNHTAVNYPLQLVDKSEANSTDYPAESINYSRYAVIDEKTEKQCLERLDDIEVLLEDGNLVPEEIEELENEKEKIEKELRNYKERYGKRPSFTNPNEKARKAVSARIKRAIEAIGAEIPELERHFRNSITTGNKCVYDPQKDGKKIEWDLKPD